MNVTPEKLAGADLVFTAPPSKSYTHRALIAGALARGETTISAPLYADDTRLTMAALRQLGIGIRETEDRIVIEGCDGAIPDREPATLDLGNSGTSLRLLASLCLLCRHPVVLTGNARMQERPVGPLAEAIRRAGGTVEYLGRPGCPPIRVSGRLAGGQVPVDGSVSSQFVSSVLMAAPYAERDVEVTVRDRLASAPYLDITCDVMEAFGSRVMRTGYSRFAVSTNERYRGRTYAIEGDYSSASYFFAIAAICGGRVTVKNLVPTSVQGDRQFLLALRAMGCTVTFGSDSVTVERTGPLSGIGTDMSTAPDTVQTLCMVAAAADGPTRLTGIGHLKFKESDRINGTAERLRSLGADIEGDPDSLTIRPAPLHGGTIDPENDHRTAMSFAVLGLGTGGITIRDAECVNKSFPGFWDELRRAGVKV
jgi:3-phosphoshikimate 1-carboxyvinyltransferase